MSDLPPATDKELSDPPPTEEIYYLSRANDGGGYTQKEWLEFGEEIKKSDGFGIDFSKYRCWFNWNPLDLDDTTIADDPDTDRDLAEMMANRALTEHNEERGTELKLVKVWRANYHPAGGYTFFLSFNVIYPSDNEVKAYRAVVLYMFKDGLKVISCMPKPSS